MIYEQMKQKSSGRIGSLQRDAKVAYLLASLICIIAMTPACGPDNDSNGSAGSAVGRQKWRFETDGTVQSTPAIGPDGQLYVGSHDHNLYSVCVESGELQWKVETGGIVTSSPAVDLDRGLVYFGSADNHVYAVDVTEGTVRWTFQTNDSIRASPPIGPTGTVYIGSFDNHVYTLMGDTGEVRWSYQTGGRITISSPAVGPGGNVYVGSDDNHLYALKMLGQANFNGPLKQRTTSPPLRQSETTE